MFKLSDLDRGILEQTYVLRFRLKFRITLCNIILLLNKSHVIINDYRVFVNHKNKFSCIFLALPVNE